MNCRICASSRLELAFDLGEQPWANNFLLAPDVGKEPRYPLRLVHCNDCHTAQLDFTVPKELMFGDHTYLSGVTESLRRHFDDLAHYVDSTVADASAEKSALDIGSNDGTQLESYRRLGYRVLGVECSTTTAAIAEKRGIPTLNRFFNESTAQEIADKFAVINASGVFFHLEELHSATGAVRRLLAQDGVFVVQFLYMKQVVQNTAFDQIYHEHLLYYNLATLDHLLRGHGLELFDAYLSPIHGGSVIGFAAHRGRRNRSERLVAMMAEEERAGANTLAIYRGLAGAALAKRDAILERLQGERARGRIIFGLGAPVKGNTLLNFLALTKATIPYLLERNALRRDRFAPGSHIPVLMEDEVNTVPDVYFVLAWNFKEEILRRYARQAEGGAEFFFPIEPKEAECARWSREQPVSSAQR